MSTLLTFVAKGPVIHPDQPRTSDPQWIAAVNDQRAKNYIQYLNCRQKKIDALAKNLLKYGEGSLKTSFPDEPSVFLTKTLSTLGSNHLSLGKELHSAYKPDFAPLSNNLKGLLEPTTYRVKPTLTKLLQSKSLNILPFTTLEARFKKAIRYLHPRTVAFHETLRHEDISMPQDTTLFMKSVLEGSREPTPPLSTTSLSVLSTLSLKGHSYVLKTIAHPSDPSKEQQAKKLFNQEIINNLLFSIDSRNITNLKAVTEDTLIFEHLEGGDLFKCFKEIPPKQFQQFSQTIVSAMLELESKGYCHADLKLENIFIDKKFSYVKVGDLGLSHPIVEKRDGGSLYYIAPEILQGQAGTSISSDIFSLGIIYFIYLFHSIPEAYISISRQPKYSTLTQKQELELNIQTIRGRSFLVHELERCIQTKLSENTPELERRDPGRLFRGLAKDCLSINPSNRPSLLDIKTRLDSPVFTTTPSQPNSPINDLTKAFMVFLGIENF